MTDDLILFFDIFHNEIPTNAQAIDAYNEYISLQKTNKPIPENLQAFINYEILRLKAAHESSTEKTLNLYTTPETQRKNNILSFENQVTPILMYYLFYISYSNTLHITKRRKEVAQHLHDIGITKSIYSQEHIKKTLEYFEKNIPKKIKNLGRLEACKYYLILFQTSTLDLNKSQFEIYDYFLESMNHMLDKHSQPKLSSTEIKILLKNRLETDINTYKNIRPALQDYYKNNFFIELAKQIASETYEKQSKYKNDKESAKQAKIEYLSFVLFKQYTEYHPVMPNESHTPNLDEFEKLNKKYTIF